MNYRYSFNCILLVTLLTATVIQKVAPDQFNMYYTDEFNGEMQHTCLRYTVLDDITVDATTSTSQHQFILYCFRPIHNVDIEREKTTTLILNSTENVFSVLNFNQLKIQNITTFDLLTWSAPVDLTERYASYLVNGANSGIDSQQYFYNCTSPWFGTMCQYTFEMIESFSNIVKNAFRMRHSTDNQLRNQNSTCYIHFPCKYRGWGAICLDWREICDGKVDCIDDGADEKNCFGLEQNECEENEYRCQNGLCIPQEFLRDDNNNPECLDQTDESLAKPHQILCSFDPSFRCEEHTCRISKQYQRQFPCGDGECFSTGPGCANERNSWLHRIRTHFENYDFCWIAMYCLTKLSTRQTSNDHLKLCRNFTSLAARILVREHCPSLFDFPTDFVLYGHVRLLYTNDDFVLTDSDYILPVYVCYRKELCDFLPPTIYLTMPNNESVTCRYFRQLNLTSIPYEWMNIVNSVTEFFQMCSSIDNNTYCLEDTVSLFHCPNTKKCVSKHRLVDGINDCRQNEDEHYKDSCSLNDKFRFKCQTDARCLAPILIDDGAYDCYDRMDENKRREMKGMTRISFQTLCDGFVDLTPIIINGREETDESDCEHWFCNNSYTRCNGIWNCRNGADEINCPPWRICGPLEHICISINNYTIICLSINKTNDGKIDCLGGTDERYYCQDKYPTKKNERFLCGNNTNQCIATRYICNHYYDCPSGDDEKFCLGTITGLCDTMWDGKLYLGANLLCQLDVTEKSVNVYFSLKNFPNYSLLLSPVEQAPSQYINYISSLATQTISHFPSLSRPSTWRCNRGLNIRFWQEYKCLCPPSYYGDLCEYQNQRVSLTIQVRTEAEWRTIFSFLITLIDDNEHVIDSYDQFSYIGIRDCIIKFSTYLLYSTRPKDATKNYNIRIDAFEKQSFTHRGSWLYPIRFSFLPVHRIAVHLIIPWTMSSNNCNLNCIHGHCIFTLNNPKNIICQCDHGWSGKQCHLKQQCNCSPQSLCMGSSNNRSICLCPIGMFGPRCFLTENICQSQPCYNDGQCIPNDFGRKSKRKYICLCKEGYFGENCERIDTLIDISFHSSIKIPSSILAHLITIRDLAHPTRTTLFKKIGFNQNNAVLFTSVHFRLMFVQFDGKYYFAFHHSTYSYFRNISTRIIPSHQCLSISELFNFTIVNYHTLRRLKYYHLPCQKHIDLVCFNDPLHLCLCNTDRHADCFEFDHNVTYNCQGQKFCKNGAECFQDDPLCLTSLMCVCKNCFYGNRCQYSTKGSDLSLDIILSYHIKSKLAFSKQPTIVKVSVALVLLMFVTGLTSGIFSILTFRSQSSQKAGCGIYLLTVSVVSLLIVIIFSWKVSLLIISHMGLITQRSFLLTSCVMTDYFLRIFLNTSDWLNACVASERAVAIIKGPYFNLLKSKCISKYAIILIILLITISILPDPFHRELVDDLEDSKLWCVISYSDSFALFNSVVHIFHFLVPFIINIVSALIIITMTARQRSKTQKQFSRTQHFRMQFRQHKHLLISPCILILLALPRLIMSFLSGCMSSSRDSWFFLFSYLTSFIPPILTFFVFVLPSTTYKKQFLLTVSRVNQ